MKTMLTVSFPNEEFNAAVRDGSAGPKTQAILDELKPEAVYFAERNGLRTAILIVELKDASMMPILAEPWFLTFNARVEIDVVMTPGDLENAGLEKLGEKWG